MRGNKDSRELVRKCEDKVPVRNRQMIMTVGGGGLNGGGDQKRVHRTENEMLGKQRTH